MELFDILADNAGFFLCLLYTSDAADERSSVDLGGSRIIKKNKEKKKNKTHKKKKNKEKEAYTQDINHNIKARNAKRVQQKTTII